MKIVDELTPEEFTLPPLHQAARQRDVSKTQSLLSGGADVNEADSQSEKGEGGNTPLWYAAQGLPPGGVPVARLLVEAGARVDVAGEFGMTPLHMACSWGHADMVRFLQEQGASLHLKDDYGRTPVELARADYAEGQATPQQDRTAGWNQWLEGMKEINDYFETVTRR